MMPPAVKAALQTEPTAKTETATPIHEAAALPNQVPIRLAGAKGDQGTLPLRPVAVSAKPRRQNGFQFQARVPVITGEAIYRGSFPIEGTISGQLTANGGTLTVRQYPRSGCSSSQPELDGEISFKHMLRVNGHLAGKVLSQNGTLIVAAEARVDGDIDVAVAVIRGIVNGDVVGRERVELSAEAVINGNIATRSLAVKPGAVFQGDCRMLKDDGCDK